MRSAGVCRRRSWARSLSTLTAVLAQLLFGSAVWTFVAGLFMAVEDLNVVMSRVGLLDIHLEFWILVGFVLFVLDRRWIERRQAADDETRGPPPILAGRGGASDRRRPQRPVARLAPVAVRGRRGTGRRDRGQVVGRVRLVRDLHPRVHVGDLATPSRGHSAGAARSAGRWSGSRSGSSLRSRSCRSPST